MTKLKNKNDPFNPNCQTQTLQSAASMSKHAQVCFTPLECASIRLHDALRELGYVPFDSVHPIVDKQSADQSFTIFYVPFEPQYPGCFLALKLAQQPSEPDNDWVPDPELFCSFCYAASDWHLPSLGLPVDGQLGLDLQDIVAKIEAIRVLLASGLIMARVRDCLYRDEVEKLTWWGEAQARARSIALLRWPTEAFRYDLSAITCNPKLVFATNGEGIF